MGRVQSLRAGVLPRRFARVRASQPAGSGEDHRGAAGGRIPIEVYRVGGLHFVSDGHHRVSIAAAMGQQTIEAHVTEILTASAEGGGK